LGCGSEAGAGWDSLYTTKEQSLFLGLALQHLCSFWGKREVKNPKQTWSLKLIHLQPIPFDFSQGNAAKQSICPQNRQTK